MGPVVSFCVSNHDYGRFLPATLDALLAQTYENVEVIVVDDGSTDESREVLARYGDRITVELQEQQGQAVACNRAFARSCGEIIVFHDSDDLVFPDAAEKLVEVFADPAVVMTLSRLADIDSEGRVTGGRRPPDGCALWGGDLRQLVLDRCAFFWPETTGQAYRRSLVESVMPIPVVTPPDFYLSHLGALAGRVVAIEDPIACYRVHGQNKSLVPPRHGLAWLDQKIEEREILHDAMRRHGVDLGIFTDTALATAWVPRDYIMASLRIARCRSRGEPGRWQYALEGVRSIISHPQFRYRSRARHIAWFIGSAVLPRRLARGVVVARFPHAQ